MGVFLLPMQRKKNAPFNLTHLKIPLFGVGTDSSFESPTRATSLLHHTMNERKKVYIFIFCASRFRFCILKKK